MSDFDRIFDPRYTALDLFTNRIAENKAFERSVLRHLERIEDGTAVLGNAARRHVLTFYGVGGIGKTELSRRLERWVLGELPEDGEWGKPPRTGSRVRTVRIDFHGSMAVRAVDIVLRLRTALADAGVHCPSFDVGLAAWWAQARPGIALPDLRSPSGFDVRGQINDTIAEVLNEVGANFGVGPLTVRAARTVADGIRSRRIRNRTLRECEPLAAIIEQVRFDASPYVAASLAGLLSWDLEHHPDEDKPLVVVFADAVEYVQGRDREHERLLNRIVHLTPGLLWVVTSRSGLDWDSAGPASLLPASGPGVWPGLGLAAREEPRQHPVGDLSDADVDRFLQTASGSGGNPVLGEEARERIRAGAHGLPLYLDLSLAIARSSGDAEPDPGLFGGPLPQLVGRVLADLPPAEREIARTAGLVTRFDPETVARAAGRPLGDALRFCERSLVGHDGHPMFPYRLHDAVRSALADEHPETPEAWAPADRTERAAALAEVLRTRHDDSLDSVEQRRDVLEVVARLCADHDLTVPWLLASALQLPGISRTASRFPPRDGSTWIGLVSEFLETWGERDTRRRAGRLAEFAAVPMPDDLRRTVRRFLAYSLRTLARQEEALAILQELLAEEPDSENLHYQVARSLRGLGRYRDLERHLETRPNGSFNDLRIRADLALDKADFVQAVAGPATLADHLRSRGRHRNALENEAAALWRRALSGRASVSDCDAVAEKADHGMSHVYRTALAARLLCLPAADPRVARTAEERAAHLDAVRAAFGWREYIADLVQALRRADHETVTDLRDRWIGTDRPWSPTHQIIDRVCVFAGHPPRFPAPVFADETDTTEVARRWYAAIAALIASPAEIPV